MAMPNDTHCFPSMTFFDITEVHSDGTFIVLRGKLGHVLTIRCLQTDDKKPFRLYQHEPGDPPEAGNDTEDRELPIPF